MTFLWADSLIYLLMSDYKYEAYYIYCQAYHGLKYFSSQIVCASRLAIFDLLV